MRKSQQYSVRVGDVVLDFANLYPRTELNPWHLQELTEALRAGAVFPPIRLERHTLRCVDGFHRTTATLKVYGKEHHILAELREYESDAALFAETLRLNTCHGRNLTTLDRAHSILMGRRLGLTDEQLAAALQMTAVKLERVVEARTALGVDGFEVAVKVPTSLAVTARQLTKNQEQGDQRIGGMPIGYYVRQIELAVQHDLVPWQDERTLHSLEALRLLLEETLRARVA